ncbi:helix-turn-helix domain-containing protein [Streptomyces sp. NBC_01264]|uniref:helix-turn-helix domain-containing protein n=1 Tax=Streptomyces sp. NBC_01264 TaxID=2903804 RepID=UPI00224DA9BB|nr:helix-turn-helix transcriptional regulator [Streptomyces sp. NBC_01264]MCX4781695.1 helix-turn-helix transcriptional regulator [Streptomyces sp. NBC_01264]
MAPSAAQHELAHFLRSYRARLTPEAAGLPRSSTRRLKGLRRAEVASMAGISPEYYTRLEQGRQRHPSPDVLDALATALQLDDDARLHLNRLGTAGPARQADPVLVSAPSVPLATLQLLHSLGPWPAHVVSPMRDILAWNDAEAWLLFDFSELPASHRNFAWFAFCDPRAPELLAEWEETARSNVHRLRHALAADPHNERGRQLVAELSRRSTRFAAIWEEHGVRGPTTGRHLFHHPRAGSLDLVYTAYVVPGPHNLELVVLTADEGSPTYEALQRAAAERRAPDADAGRAG